MKRVERNSRAVAVKAIMQIAPYIRVVYRFGMNFHYRAALFARKIVHQYISVVARVGISVAYKTAPVGRIYAMYVVVIYQVVIEPFA